MKIKEMTEGVSVTSLVTVLFGTIYVSGYLVTALYIRSRGISPLPLLKAQYIETGLVFVILTGMLAGIPFLVAEMAIHGRVQHNQPITPTIVIPIMVTTNFLLVILFWAIFVTEFEWETTTLILNVEIPIKNAFLLYLLAMLLILTTLPVIRMADFTQNTFLFLPKLNANVDNTLTSIRVNIIVQSLRFLALTTTVIFDILLLISIPWLPWFVGVASYYLVTVIFLICGVFLVRYLTDIFSESGRRASVWAVGVTMLLLCYYSCVTAYSFVIYNNIPTSRGGKCPTSIVEFTYNTQNKAGLPTEAYVLEESEDTFYVVSKSVQNWFTSNEDVIAVPRSSLLYFKFVHISSGEPRINHLQ